MLGHEISSVGVKYDSPPLQDNLHMKGLSPRLAIDSNPELWEYDLYSKQKDGR